MSGGFNNPIIGGGGALVYPAIHSPGFTQSPLSGWSIDKNGNAYFATLTVGSGVVRVSVQATAPASPNTGDLWFDTSAGNAMYQWDGSAWAAFQWGTAAIGAGAITTTQIAAAAGILGSQLSAAAGITGGQLAAAAAILGSQLDAAAGITGSQLANGTVTAAQIAAGTITAGLLAAGIVVAGIIDGTTVTGAQIVADGTSGQVLVYSGTPAAGNLIASDSGAAGTDAHGNAFLQGQVSYGFDSANNVWIAQQNTGNGIAIWTASSAAGPWGQTYWAVAQGSASAGKWIIGGANANTPLVANDPTANGIKAESWHTAALVNGWTGTLAYRLTAQGDLQISADLTAGTTTNGTTIFTFPPPYRPALKRRIPCAFDGSVASGGNPYFILNTDGTFTVHWVSSTQTLGGFEATVRLA